MAKSTKSSAALQKLSATSVEPVLQAKTKPIATKSGTKTDPRKRLAANARERKRMHLLNKAYNELRMKLNDAENKSKYDVLVQAKEYIRELTRICQNFDKQDGGQSVPKLNIKIEPSQDPSDEQIEIELYERKLSVSPAMTSVSSNFAASTPGNQMDNQSDISSPSASISSFDQICYDSQIANRTALLLNQHHFHSYQRHLYTSHLQHPKAEALLMNEYYRRQHPGFQVSIDATSQPMAR